MCWPSGDIVGSPPRCSWSFACLSAGKCGHLAGQTPQHPDVERQVRAPGSPPAASACRSGVGVLVAAEHQPALLRARVHARLVNSDDRMMRLDPGDRLRDEELVARPHHRHGSHLVPEESRPGAGRVDDGGAVDHATDVRTPWIRPSSWRIAVTAVPGATVTPILDRGRGELPGDERRVEVPVLGREQDGAGPGRPESAGASRSASSPDRNWTLTRRSCACAASRRIRASPSAVSSTRMAPTRVKLDRASGGPLEPGQRLHGLVDQPDHQLGRRDLRGESGRTGRRLRPKIVAVEQDDVAGPRRAR